MNIISIPGTINNDSEYIKLSNLTGNSDALIIPSSLFKFNAQLSGITGGSVTLQYTLSPRNDIVADTAIWLAWSVGAVTASGGHEFNNTVNAIRLRAGTGVTYTFQLFGRRWRH